MIIMGIDPGTATTGWGVIEKKGTQVSYVAAGVITTPAKTVIQSRLRTIYDDCCELLKSYTPEVVVIEELFFNTNTTTAMTVGQARGVVLLACEQMGCQIFSLTPSQVKMAMTGYGRADKKQMQEMVKLLLKLSSVPKPDDAADALALALAYQK